MSLKKLIVGSLITATAGLCVIPLIHTDHPSSQAEVTEKPADAKSRAILSHLSSDEATMETLIFGSGADSIEDLNRAYTKAVELKKYDLAIKLYQMGATNCYDKNQDILLVAIHSGNFELMNALIDESYPVDVDHIYAAKTLVNVDQPNWAFIYNQADGDDKGYSYYRVQAQNAVEKILYHYKLAFPLKSVEFLSEYDHLTPYHQIFGKNPSQEFQAYLEQVIENGYSFDVAKHGTQKRTILLDKEGHKVGILKSKNEHLVYELDYDHFAKVPPFAQVNLPEYGQVYVQKWVQDSMIIKEHQMNPESASTIEQLHHIRLLDLRVGNSDRNRGNLIVTQVGNQPQFIPIDHDLIMFYIPNDFNWQSNYLNVPFSHITQDYIQKLDVEKDAQVMRDLGYKEHEVKAMKLRTCMLKFAVQQNLMLKQIDMLYRFFYYDLLEKSHMLSSFSTAQDYEKIMSPHLQQCITQIQHPTEVWKLIGNNFEFYI